MGGFVWQVFLIQLITIILICMLLYYLLRELKLIKYQKRFDPYALSFISNDEKSFFDLIIEYFWIFIPKISILLNKSAFLKKYSQKYEKHIEFEEKSKKNKMDYISIKLISAIFLFLLNMIASTFHYSKINLMSELISFLIGFFIPDIILALKFKKKRKRIEDDLLKAIIIMNNSFKSGRNIMQAVEIVKNELEGPISDEFKKIYMDMNYGLSTDVVFNRFYERVKLEDAKYITSSLSLLNRTGGNIVRVFSTIEKSFFNKKKLQNEMKSLTSASIFVFRLLLILPFFFAFAILIMNPTYFNPFFESPFGFLLFGLIVFLYIIYVWTIRKILKVKL